jgi:hypothetical protein
MTKTAIDFISDVPLDLAQQAHAGTSFTPETRGEQERASYAATLVRDFENLSRYANTDEKKTQLEHEFARYRAGYKQRVIAHLSARSRCLSPMITGPSNFPTRRNEKLNNVADRRLQELVEFRERALAAIRRALTPELRPVMAGDSDAVERLKAKIAAAEELQQRMKAANAAIRKYAKAGAEAQTAALVALGLTKANAEELLKPDFAGRIGFADFELQNNNANIRRMKKRLEQISAAKAEATTEVAGDDGVSLEDCPAENRIRIRFPGKPASDVRTDLKANGFRWAPTLGCWQAYRNHHSLAYAQRFVSRPTPAAAAAAAAPDTAGGDAT